MQDLIVARKYSRLLDRDQLAIERSKGVVFSGFQEGKIEFPPTYRMMRGTDLLEYSNKKNQNASYTDRILWRPAPSQASRVKLLFYAAVPQLNTSDHRPVCAAFNVETNLPYVNLEKARRRCAVGWLCGLCVTPCSPRRQTTTFMNHGSCVLSMPFLRFSDQVLDPNNLKYAAAGMPTQQASRRSRESSSESKALEPGEGACPVSGVELTGRLTPPRVSHRAGGHHHRAVAGGECRV